MIHQPIDSGHHYAALVLQKMAEYLEPLPGQKISMDIRTVKQKVPGRVQPGILLEIRKILIKFPRPGVVVSYN